MVAPILFVPNAAVAEGRKTAWSDINGTPKCGSSELRECGKGEGTVVDIQIASVAGSIVTVSS